MSWIKTISITNATGKLKKIFQKYVSSSHYIDNILLVHSLRPHTLDGHMSLYKSVLHHSSNQLPKDKLEAIGVYVSALNQCNYCVEHHLRGYKNLVNDNARFESARQALLADRVEDAFSFQDASLFNYAKKLTLHPFAVSEIDLNKIREAGFDDGAILEINQVVAYFNYANRTALGLGVSLEKDTLM